MFYCVISSSLWICQYHKCGFIYINKELGHSKRDVCVKVLAFTVRDRDLLGSEVVLVCMSHTMYVKKPFQ